MNDLDAFVVDAFLRRYEQQFDDEPEPPESGHLRERLALAEEALVTLAGDPLSLAALSSGMRTEVLANAQREVDRARDELDAVEVAHETSVLNVWQLSDLFTPDDFREASIPEHVPRHLSVRYRRARGVPDRRAARRRRRCALCRRGGLLAGGSRMRLAVAPCGLSPPWNTMRIGVPSDTSK